MKKLLSLLLFWIMLFSLTSAKENSVEIRDCKVTISAESIKDFSSENRQGIVSYNVEKNSCKGVKISFTNVLGGEILYKEKNREIIMKSIFHDNSETTIQFSVSKIEKNGFTYKKTLNIPLSMGTYNLQCDEIIGMLGLCPKVDISLSVADKFGFDDYKATVQIIADNYTDQKPVLRILEIVYEKNDGSVEIHGEENVDMYMDYPYYLSLFANGMGEKVLKSITFEVRFEGQGDQDYIEPYEITIDTDLNLGTYSADL